MRDYEVVYIFRSTLDGEQIEEKLESYHAQITGDGAGEITAVERWGQRQLAYPLEKQETGHYVVAQFRAEPAVLDEFERVLKLDDDLLRHLVVIREDELPTPPSARHGQDDEEDDEEEEDEERDEGEEDDEEGDEDEDESDEEE